ncbi:MAG: hemolysin III family protein [Epulopiscium sp.]|nr:hemolysin III family protein [Candidatus Epulonipiscium sp.]
MYSIKEEIINAITHGFGIIASLIGLVILLIYAIMERSTISIVAFSIYGFCSLALYTSSTVYHSIQNEKWKKISRVFDHSSIFLLIAGTYTPVALLTMTGYWRIGILASVWVIAILGIGFKIITFPNFDKHKVFSLSLYILMGWIVIVALRPMLKAIPLGFFGWLLAGGLVYTFGTIFYSIKKIPYHHAIWHLFVLAGSVLHFVGIYKYLI